MSVKSIVFASLEYGMTTAFVSSELESIVGEVKEKYLQLNVSDEDGEAYLFDYCFGYYVIGKFTKFINGTIFDSRPNIMLHCFFLDKLEFRMMQQKLEKSFFPAFISDLHEDFNRADELSFEPYIIKTEAEKKGLWELGFIRFVEFINARHSVHVQNDVFSNKLVFFFLISSFDVEDLSKVNIRVGCKNLIWGWHDADENQNCLNICKQDEKATVKLSDILNKKIKDPYCNLLLLKDYYRLSSANRHTLKGMILDFAIKEKEESFDKCVKSCEQDIGIMIQHFRSYNEQCYDKKKRRSIHLNVKKANKNIIKIKKLIEKLIEAERQIQENI